MLKRSALFSVWLCLLILLTAGCDRGGSSDDGEDSAPLPEQKLSGVWLGYLNSGETIFYFGIITEENEVVLIGSDSQFSGPEGALEVYPSTFAAQGSLMELILSYSTTDFVAAGQPESWNFISFVAAKALLWGTYQDSENNNENSFMLIYNTTYDIVPNIANIRGTWHLANTMGVSGDTVSLIITPSLENTTSASIQVNRSSGGAMFQGGGTISIHYSNNVPYNVYDVSLKTIDGIDLSGLAAYVEEVSTEGIDVPKTMAIGIFGTDDEGRYRTFSGLASFHSTLIE